MKTRTIFLLELEGGRSFLFARDPMTPSTHNIIQLFIEAAMSYEYVRTYKPVLLLNQWPEESPLDIDHRVKQEMLMRGMEYVRGGSYSSPLLTPSQIECLTVELAAPAKEPVPQEVIKEILDTYAKCPHSNKELIRDRVKVAADFEQYKKEFALQNELATLDLPLVKNYIDWLEETCKQQTEMFSSHQTPLYRLQQPALIEMYRRVRRTLRRVYSSFMTFSKGVLAIESDDLPLQYPEFLLDDFFFLLYPLQLDRKYPAVVRLCNQYRFFVTYVENRLQECEFDVASWGDPSRFEATLALFDLCII
jgi:hypothetical protein